VRPPAQTLADTVRWWVEHPGIAAPRLHRRKPEPARQRERLALVTGASGGIGGQTARRLAATGYRVVLVARRQDRLDRLAAEIRAAGGAAEVLVAGLASSDGPQAVYEQVMERFGGIDVLVNTASLTQLIVLFLPVMRRAGHGHVINVSSRAGSLPFGSPVPGEPLAAKPEAVAEAILGLLRRPRRAVWVPGALRIMPWVEAGFGWILDRLGPLLLRRRGVAA
jgi:NADPH:quinone reductase-like Zn-dependent oxidoreductase